MSAAPIKIVISPPSSKPELAPHLNFPHTLTTLEGKSDAEAAAILAETDVLVSGSFKAGWRQPNAKGPRIVHSVGAGVDAIDASALPKGTKIHNVYGHERGVSEQAFMLILALQRHLFELDRSLRKGDWLPQYRYLPELGGRNLLILGLGHIGKELVRWGKFMDMNVSVLTRSPAKAKTDGLGLKAFGGLNELSAHLPSADFLIVAIPATPETSNLIGEKELKLMKPTAYIVNVGRAPVINEKALYEALRTRQIAGAGLDVWYEYPTASGQVCLPSKLPFQELDNVIMTPHKPTAETMAFRWKEIAKNVGRYARGEPMENFVRTVE